MNTDPSPRKGDTDKEQSLPDGVQESIYPYSHELNISDGGEFLDDGIRMRDQPYCEIDPEENE